MKKFLFCLTLAGLLLFAACDQCVSQKASDDLRAEKHAVKAVEKGRRDVLDQRRAGRIILFVTHRGLQARRNWPDLFAEGDYLPLEVTGRHAERVVAIARRRGSQLAIGVVPRWTVGLVGFGGPPPIGQVGEDTAVKIPAGLSAATLTNAFTGEQLAGGEQLLPLSQLLSQFPVALFAQ